MRNFQQYRPLIAIAVVITLFISIGLMVNETKIEERNTIWAKHLTEALTEQLEGAVEHFEKSN